MAKTKTSFKKGEIHNPKGRPKKGYSITEWFKEMLNSKPEVKDAIGNSIIAKATQGDTAALKLVWNYMDGMPEQKNILAGDEENPISIDVAGVLNKVYGKTRPDSDGGVPQNS